MFFTQPQHPLIRLRKEIAKDIYEMYNGELSHKEAIEAADRLTNFIKILVENQSDSGVQ